MSWTLRITGLTREAALGAVDDARDSAKAAILCRMAKSQPELPLPVRMKLRTDALGYAVTFGVGAATPPGTMLLVEVRDRAGQRLGTRDILFSDADDLFLEASTVRGRRCRAFIPFGALDYQASGTYTMRVRCLWHDADLDKIHEFGQEKFAIELPPPPKCLNRTEFARPLVWLSMRVARANHDITPGEVRRLSRLLTHALYLSPRDLLKLRNIMLERPSVKLGDVIDTAIGRFCNLSPLELLNILAAVAWADGNVDEREVEVIRRVARHLKLDSETWRATVRAHRLHT